jgi:hypothetical protein
MPSEPIVTVPPRPPATAIVGHSFLRNVPDCFDYNKDPFAPLVLCWPGAAIGDMFDCIQALPPTIISLALCIGSNDLTSASSQPREVALHLQSLVNTVFATTSVERVAVFLPGRRIPKDYAQPRHYRFCKHFNRRVSQFRHFFTSLLFNGTVTFLNTGLEGTLASHHLYRRSDGYHPGPLGAELIARRCASFFALSLMSRSVSYISHVTRRERISRHDQYLAIQTHFAPPPNMIDHGPTPPARLATSRSMHVPLPRPSTPNRPPPLLAATPNFAPGNSHARFPPSIPSESTASHGAPANLSQTSKPSPPPPSDIGTPSFPQQSDVNSSNSEYVAQIPTSNSFWVLRDLPGDGPPPPHDRTSSGLFASQPGQGCKNKQTFSSSQRSFSSPVPVHPPARVPFIASPASANCSATNDVFSTPPVSPRVPVLPSGLSGPSHPPIPVSSRAPIPSAGTSPISHPLPAAPLVVPNPSMGTPECSRLPFFLTPRLSPALRSPQASSNAFALRDTATAPESPNDAASSHNLPANASSCRFGLQSSSSPR